MDAERIGAADGFPPMSTSGQAKRKYDSLESDASKPSVRPALHRAPSGLNGPLPHLTLNFEGDGPEIPRGALKGSAGGDMEDRVIGPMISVSGTSSEDEDRALASPQHGTRSQLSTPKTSSPSKRSRRDLVVKGTAVRSPGKKVASPVGKAAAASNSPAPMTAKQRAVLRRREQNREASARHRAKQKGRETELEELRAENDNLRLLVNQVNQYAWDLQVKNAELQQASGAKQQASNEEQQEMIMGWVLKNFRLRKKITLNTWSNCVKGLMSVQSSARSRTTTETAGEDITEEEFKAITKAACNAAMTSSAANSPTGGRGEAGASASASPLGISSALSRLLAQASDAAPVAEVEDSHKASLAMASIPSPPVPSLTRARSGDARTIAGMRQALGL